MKDTSPPRMVGQEELSPLRKRKRMAPGMSRTAPRSRSSSGSSTSSEDLESAAITLLKGMLRMAQEK